MDKLKERTFKMITMGIKQFKDPFYHGVAAQLAFYFLLSLLPTIILVSQVLGSIFGSSISSAVDWLLAYVDGGVATELKKLLSYRVAMGHNIIMILVVLWSASKAKFALVRITNFTFTDGRSTGNGFFRERIRSVLSMGITLLAVIFSLLVMVYGPVILGFLFDILGISHVAAQAWLVLRWPVAAALYFLVISYDYYTMPTIRVKYRQIIPGSIFASIGLLAVTFVYSAYVDMGTNYDLLYGSLANMVALMLWFHFLAWVLCLGMLFNKVWMDTAGEKIGE